MSLVLPLSGEMHLSRSSSHVPCLPLVLETLQNLQTFAFCSLLTGYKFPCACHTKRHLNVQKCFVYPSPFYTFDFKMCFAPQPPALFRHLNFQKRSENGVFCTVHFDLETCFTPLWTFGHPKVVRTCRVFYMLTSTCASCRGYVQLFISHLARWLRTPRFSEPTFRPPEPQITRKT